MSTAILRLHRCPFPVSCISIEESVLVGPGKPTTTIALHNETAASHCGWNDKNLERSRGTINPDLSEASASLHNALSLCAPDGSIHCSESHIQRAKIVT